MPTRNVITTIGKNTQPLIFGSKINSAMPIAAALKFYTGERIKVRKLNRLNNIL